MLSIKGTTIKWLNAKTFFESKIEAADKLRLKAVAVTAAVTQKLPVVTVAQEPFQFGGLEALAAVPATGWQCLSSCCAIVPVSPLVLLAQQHCCLLEPSVPLISTCNFFYSTYTSSGLAFCGRVFVFLFCIVVIVGQCCWCDPFRCCDNINKIISLFFPHFLFY